MQKTKSALLPKWEETKSYCRDNPGKVVRLSLFAALCFYVALCPLIVMAFFEFLPFKIQAYQPDTPEYHREEVHFDEADLAKDLPAFQNKAVSQNKISAWHFKNPEAKYTVLLHHGQRGNLEHYKETAHCLYDAGASVFLYDYSGYGKSTGRPSNAQVLADAQAAGAYINRVLQVPDEKLVHAGVSIGTGPCLETAALHKNVPGLILVSPYQSMESVWRLRLPSFNLYPQFAFPSPDMGCGLKEPMKPSYRDASLLMFHATDDTILPVEQADAIYAASNGAKTYIRGPMEGHVGSLAGGDKENSKSAVSVCRRFFESLPK